MNTFKCDEASRLHIFIKVLGITAVVFLMLVSIAGCVSFAGIPNSGSSNISISNKSDEAIKAYDRVIELNPQDSDGWTTKGNALYKLNNLMKLLMYMTNQLKLTRIIQKPGTIKELLFII